MANILIADDDPVLMDLYRLKFTKKGHSVRSAPDRETLLKELGSKAPDVILLDRRLGDSDGLQLLSEVRQTDNGKSIPAFLLTNLDPTAEDMETVKRLAPAKYLIKEKVDLDDLSQTIADAAKN